MNKFKTIKIIYTSNIHAIDIQEALIKKKLSPLYAYWVGFGRKKKFKIIIQELVVKKD